MSTFINRKSIGYFIGKNKYHENVFFSGSIQWPTKLNSYF